ncbi:MAG: hypothetical protein ACYTKD_18975, partial [Planctomycetota bacterium]
MGNRASGLGPQRLPALVRLVNAHARLVPPGWELTPEQVARVVDTHASLWGRHYPEEREGSERATWRTSSVERHGCLVAAAQYMRPAPDDGALSPGNRDTAFVRWIVADPEVPGAAEDLAQAVCREAAELGCARVDVSSRNGFGVGWLGVPTAWPHVVEGLARAGFAPG